MEKKPELNAPPAPAADKKPEDPELTALKSNFKAAAERQVAVMRDQLELKHLSGTFWRQNRQFTLLLRHHDTIAAFAVLEADFGDKNSSET